MLPDTKTPSEIESAVRGREQDTEALRLRMEEEYSLYRLDQWVDDFDRALDNRFRKYTSNFPQVYVDKVLSWMVGSKENIQIHQGYDNRLLRDFNNRKEQFAIGIGRQVDNRLKRMMHPSWREEQSAFIGLRGWWAQRHVMRQQADGSTVADVMPWDPLHVTWQVGRDGLEWICHKTRRSGAEILAEYPVPDGVLLHRLTGAVNGDLGGLSREFDIYDFYDNSRNYVVVEGEYLSNRQHFAGEVPGSVGLVGPMPLIRSRATDQFQADWGPGLLGPIKSIQGKMNFILSVMLYLVGLSRNQAYILYSIGGNKTLPENPNEEGSEIPLEVGERFETLKLLEMAKDTNIFLQLVSGEVQRGSLPFSTFGELAFQLSGLAINTLNQDIESKMQRRLQAKSDARSAMFNSLARQYATGRFGNNIRLSGIGQSQASFDERFDPFELLLGGEIEVEYIAQLPQDEITKVTVANMLRDGHNPLVDDLSVREEVLKLPNPDRVADRIKAQQAERMLPQAALYGMAQALMAEGREEEAQMYVQAIMQLMAAMPQLGGSSNGQQSMNRAGPPGMHPQVAARGGSRPVGTAPTPQAGPNVPPGTPRPGAGSIMERLAGIGLAGPRG